MIEINKTHCMDNVWGMKLIPDNSINLTITSPPYDDLRDYNGFSWNVEEVSEQLFRITKPGGTVVWIVGDATIKGSETGSSFRQALWFMNMGFNLHDTMIWKKHTFTAVGALKTRYAPIFDYMFIFTKGKIKTFNPIKDRPNKYAGTKVHGTIRQKNGNTYTPSRNDHFLKDFGQRYNIWEIANVGKRGMKHPAVFPEQLAEDHIISWSNINDLILDPFMGSGTVARMCKKLNRNYIGFDISQEYCNLANQ